MVHLEGAIETCHDQELCSAEEYSELMAELSDLRRDRETLRKIREVVNRPTVSQDNLSVYSMWCTALFEEIQQLVREEQEKGDG